ncbi:MAG: hypothetical protein IID61_04730 [SAR324 cluster bacterium]|nr:hypothetical protein [SAR324 cluster bacterium]
MTDIKIQNVLPVQDHRPADRIAPKEGGSGQLFEQTLANTLRSLSEVESTVDNAVQAKDVKAVSIQDEIKASNEQFQKMMKAKQNLAMLFHNIQNPDKG